MEITWNDFEKVQMHVGTIIDVRPFPEAKKPAFQLQIDFGPEIGIRKSSAQITALYTPEQLIGRQIVAVINFPKKQIGPFMSECLVLGALDPRGVVLLHPGISVENGARIA